MRLKPQQGPFPHSRASIAEEKKENTMAAVSLTSIEKSYGAVSIIAGLDLEIADGEFVVLVGASGCGKSTTLRMIAGLDMPTKGLIKIGGKDVTNLGPGQRNCSMVFQNYALYPHMSVNDNIGFGMRIRGNSPDVIIEATNQAATSLSIVSLLNRLPKALSGGQRQRVAIGRAIVRKPDVFLFDEPLSNLDAKLRIEMRAEIKDLHRRLGSTIVYVTHDQVEAMTMADRVVIMEKGRISQAAAPLILYEKPANTFVAQFIGTPAMNLFPASIIAQDGKKMLRLETGADITLVGPTSYCDALSDRRRVTFGIRPEHTMHGMGNIMMQVRNLEPLGSHTLALGKIGSTFATISLDSHDEVLPGDKIPVSFDMNKAHFFDSITGERIE